MTFLNPRKWSLASWIVLILWLIPSIIFNIPSNSSIEIRHPDGSPMSLDERRFHSVFDYAGWPFWYYQRELDWTGPPTIQFSVWLAFLNAAIVAITLISLIYTFQRLALRFTIKTVMAGSALFAMILSLGQSVFWTQSFHLTLGYFYLVYHSPVLTALTLLIYDRRRNSVKKKI